MKTYISMLTITKYIIVSMENYWEYILIINTFDEDVTRLCEKASPTLARVSNYMDTQQRCKIMTAYINSQFGYCSLVWMFHSRTLNNCINKIHERSLRIVYTVNNLTYEELIQKDESFTIQERNIHALAIEMYKMVNNLPPVIMNLVIPLQEINHYYSRFPFKSRNVNTVRYDRETISYLGPILWAIIGGSLGFAVLRF